MPVSRRALLGILVLLSSSLALAVLLAIVCALWSPIHWSIGRTFSEPAAAWQWGDDAVRPPNDNVFETTGSGAGFRAVRIERHHTLFPATTHSTPTAWGHTVHAVYRVGWPFRCLEWTATSQDSLSPRGRASRSDIGGWPIPKALTRTEDLRTAWLRPVAADARRVPRRPLWGLNANTAIFDVILAAAANGRGVLRRYRHCRIKCGYPTLGLARWPECGQPTPEQ